MTLTTEVRRELAAPTEQVFAAWTEPDRLANWFWPFPATYELDVRPGGAFYFGSDVIGVGGRFREVLPQRRLVYSWIWDGESVETTVCAEFRPIPAGTELMLTHSDNLDEQTRDNHQQGWSDCIDRLGPFLQRR